MRIDVRVSTQSIPCARLRARCRPTTTCRHGHRSTPVVTYLMLLRVSKPDLLWCFHFWLNEVQYRPGVATGKKQLDDNICCGFKQA